MKIVKYDINLNEFDEAGGDLNDSKADSLAIDKEENKTDLSFRNDDSLRMSTPSKSMIESDYQRNLIERNKKRRNRLEREAKGSNKHDSVEKAEIYEETKDPQPQSLMNNRQNLLQMLNKGRSLIESKNKSSEDTNLAQEGKVNAEVIQEVKIAVEKVPTVEVPITDLKEDTIFEPELEESKEAEDTLPEQSNKSSKVKTHSKPKQTEGNSLQISKADNKKKTAENNKNVEVYE